MKRYKKHAQLNLFIALPILLGAIYYFLHPNRELIIAFSAAFIYSAFFMNPGLNLTSQARLISLRGILSSPFRLYAKIFAYRGLARHIIFGPLTRIAWLAILGCLVFLLMYKTLPTKGTALMFYKHYQPFILYCLAGICFADWGHLLLDRKASK